MSTDKTAADEQEREFMHKFDAFKLDREALLASLREERASQQSMQMLCDVLLDMTRDPMVPAKYSQEAKVLLERFMNLCRSRLINPEKP